jgi:hypothetical protein
VKCESVLQFDDCSGAACRVQGSGCRDAFLADLFSQVQQDAQGGANLCFGSMRPTHGWIWLSKPDARVGWFLLASREAINIPNAHRCAILWGYKLGIGKS